MTDKETEPQSARFTAAPLVPHRYHHSVMVPVAHRLWFAMRVTGFLPLDIYMLNNGNLTKSMTFLFSAGWRSELLERTAGGGAAHTISGVRQDLPFKQLLIFPLWSKFFPHLCYMPAVD